MRNFAGSAHFFAAMNVVLACSAARASAFSPSCCDHVRTNRGRLSRMQPRQTLRTAQHAICHRNWSLGGSKVKHDKNTILSNADCRNQPHVYPTAGLDRIDVDVTNVQRLQSDKSDERTGPLDLDMSIIVPSTILFVVLMTSFFVFGSLNSDSYGDGGFPQMQNVLFQIHDFIDNPTEKMELLISNIDAMGSMGIIYFGLLYILAEVLAVPAIPLTASAGYLFGVAEGTLVVLVSASVAATISFLIGRTVLRSTVQQWLEQYPEFVKLDKAIEKEGFKLMLLLRLSPLFPFALSNYLYGASSVRFWPYFFATIIGFAPGTVAYVYSGQVGKVLTLGSENAQPWYVYLGGFALLGGFLKLLADAATGIIQSLEQETE